MNRRINEIKELCFSSHTIDSLNEECIDNKENSEEFDELEEKNSENLVEEGYSWYQDSYSSD